MTEKCEIKLKKSSILLAEDEDSLRNSFKKVLLLYVQKVYTVSDGEEALDVYNKYKPDIIITDLKMPKLNGLDLIKIIRKENENIPIIVTSAYTDQSFLLESIKLSLVEYAIKPLREINLSQLLERCAEILLKNSKTIIDFGKNGFYDYNNKTFSFQGDIILLTNKEIDFFELLLANRGTLVTKNDIEDKLYIYDEVPPSALKNLVFKLRKKLKADIIKTISKLGYMIE
ncbi:response regulator transcription factor [Halarcobacter anaerophilus]|uniref:DNA-binding response regulator n=1 Tax=Halarcobacter anaerophilus TaxID=877500 RepID=A0A4Q0XY05_9BACT|nr:response regulator transcription factor [Halarcobacter anaerophilus]QDF28171.1 two-component system response regulator [Halarcobacter anaerophilus]RXJ62516.1 DNA-binding response regulator [Halarcobacter anaerophilus]